jgi:hypothetical protein
MYRYTIILLLIFASISSMGQKGGESVYNFLHLTNSARVSALGGDNISINDDDINLVFHNPALLSSGMDQNMNLNYVNYFAGINYGYASYAFNKENIGNFAGGIHYVNYGSFDRTDQYGNYDGSFRASEYAINLIYSRTIIDTFLTVGVNLKPIFSIYEQYTSFGTTMDFGAVYHNPRTHTSAGLVLKNLGMQFVSFSGTRERVPFEIQAGITQGLAHAPFRFSLLLQNLEKWDLTYDDPGDDSYLLGGELNEVNKFDIFADKLMRHTVFGVEFLLGESFHLDFGYNYKRRMEMKMDSWPGMVGFSWGFGFRVSKFHVAYGRSRYHLAGGTSHFSLTTNLSEFYKSSL